LLVSSRPRTTTPGAARRSRLQVARPARRGAPCLAGLPRALRLAGFVQSRRGPRRGRARFLDDVRGAASGHVPPGHAAPTRQTQTRPCFFVRCFSSTNSIWEYFADCFFSWRRFLTCTPLPGHRLLLLRPASCRRLYRFGTASLHRGGYTASTGRGPRAAGAGVEPPACASRASGAQTRPRSAKGGVGSPLADLYDRPESGGAVEGKAGIIS
jgi:hypothetical protein